MTEKELVEKCKEREPKYQRMLVDQYTPMLMGTCLRYCKNRADAKDCLQEAWINIFRAIDKYEYSGSFKGWMQRIAINCCLSQHRKSASIIRIESNRQREPSSKLPVIYAALEVKEIIKLLNRLSDTKRLVFTLYVIEGYKHAEIAELLGITESSSRSILTRARQEVRELIVYFDQAIEL